MRRFITFATAAALVTSAMPLTASAEGSAEIKSGVVDGVTYYYSYWEPSTEEIQITGAENASGDIVIPRFIDGNMVAKIADKAFFCNTEITSVTFPDVLPFIGDHAFTGCTSLERVKLPLNDVKLGTGCFKSCTALKYLDLGNFLTIIPDECFFGCNALAVVDLPETLSYVGKEAFYSCTDLKKIVIENDDINLEYRSFGSYYALREDSTAHIEDFTIFGDPGSKAAEYADNYGFAFSELKGEIAGDTDLSGTLSAADASAVLREYADTAANAAPTFTSLQKKNGDMDKDGMLTAKDASMILSIYANSQM